MDGALDIIAEGLADIGGGVQGQEVGQEALEASQDADIEVDAERAISPAIGRAQEHRAGFHVASIGQAGLIIVEVLRRLAIAGLGEQQVGSCAAHFAPADIAFDVDDGMLEVAEIVNDHLAVGRE